ncbi:hypothetical protein FA15DRAFT_711655 [Coprinopsis marcescibilis]|uniref:Uncharacterized protein n=1 Tax=Coprinopsis marcescibilis TaxID=230819 RepID=A0A5C3K9H3_COPMA|nr:hypothetical protein FA15DRAFT_711655 [Coprinopsis marcescibilis]
MFVVFKTESTISSLQYREENLETSRSLLSAELLAVTARDGATDAGPTLGTIGAQGQGDSAFAKYK